MTWELPELRGRITTYAVQIGDLPGLEVEPDDAPTEPSAQASLRDPGRSKARSRSQDKSSTSGSQTASAKAVEPKAEPSAAKKTTSGSGCSPSALQPKAMMGTLGSADKKCLEGRISKASKQTDKVTISRVLLVNAQAAKDDKEYMRLAERHLRDYSQSDADICYGYALKLKRRGRYAEAIKWAERALENRDKFASGQASKWTSNLLQIRADSAYADWEKKDKKYLSTRSPLDKIASDNARSSAKTFAKEWYDFAKESGINVTKAKSRCTSASGTTSYCQ